MWKKLKKKINKLIDYLLEDCCTCNTETIKTLENLETIDDVWVEKNGEIKRGWVWEITKKTIIIAFYDSSEIIKIHYQRPLNKSIIKDGDLTLYLNNHDCRI